jgi:hypothetical protein
LWKKAYKNTEAVNKSLQNIFFWTFQLFKTNLWKSWKKKKKQCKNAWEDYFKNFVTAKTKLWRTLNNLKKRFFFLVLRESFKTFWKKSFEKYIHTLIVVRMWKTYFLLMKIGSSIMTIIRIAKSQLGNEQIHIPNLGTVL